MPAKSKAQQKFMGLVKAYQDGDVPASKVSKAVKDAAKSMGEKEVDKYASTKHKGLPNKKEQLEAVLKENPVAIAATQGAIRAMKGVKVQGKSGRKISSVTALKDKSQPAHKKAKGIFSKLYQKFTKKKKEEPKKQSQGDKDFYKKQFNVGRSGNELEERKLDSRQKKAILIAIQYSGNMTKAVEKIEKIKKGLSKDKKVEDALRLANESKNGIEELIAENWWDKLSPEQQKAYIKKHPGSKQAQNAKDDKGDDSDNKTQSQVKPIKADKDTKRMGDSIQKKIGGSKDPDRLKLKGTQTASNGETIIQYEDSDDGSMVGVDAQGNIYEDGEKQNYGIDVSTQSDVFGDDQNAQLLYKQKRARETGDEDPFARTGKELKKEVKMRNAVKKLLKQKGYAPIFQAIDNSKRQFKQMRYSRGEIQDTLIDMFGDEDPKILQKIKESTLSIEKIIKEEIDNLLTEGTRWLMGVEQSNGKISSIYGHYDGYPEHTGKLLKKYYNTPQKIKQLMKLGKAGISFLDKSMKGGKDHSFEKPKKGETIFYARDRGEKGNYISKWRDRDGVKFEAGEEYAYIYSLKDKKWYYKSRYSNPRDWTEL